ncbi:MAG TPA: alpha/beta fold hydrolase [Xanthobacteraceae bacterium]|nr:alpha/beta fold hydrolase [Xanthobacteraceae bacterium]
MTTVQADSGGDAKRDPRIAAAITHWAARFVSNGVALTDFEEVTASITSWDEWCDAWSARAAVHEDMGRDALARGKTLSAGDHLQRAGVYYHFGKFLFVHDLPRMKATHAKAVACRRDALPFLTPPGERVAIPFEGKTLSGILRKPPGVARPPVMAMICGLDSCKEETEAYEAPFLARGIAILVFDGPGQGEAEYDFAIRGNYETATRAVVDFIGTRDDLDPSRIGLWGVSLGGYYAPRSVAFEPRIKACIALSGPYDFGAAWPTLPELTRNTFRVRSKCATDAEAQRHASTLSLAGVTSQITCPLFLVTGKLDRVVPWQDAERLAREVKGPVELLVLDDGNHVANNRGYRWRLQSADWMAEQLRA